jgi:hypothetical protein
MDMKIHKLPPNGDGQKSLFPIEVVTLDNIQCPEDSSLLQYDPVSWVRSSLHSEGILIP